MQTDEMQFKFNNQRNFIEQNKLSLNPEEEEVKKQQSKEDSNILNTLLIKTVTQLQDQITDLKSEFKKVTEEITS